MPTLPGWLFTALGFSGVVLLFVLLPYALTLGAMFRERRPVRCPETGSSETVAVGTARQVVHSLLPVCDASRLCDCTRWPARRGCDQACARQI